MLSLKDQCVKILCRKVLDLQNVEDALLDKFGLDEVYIDKILLCYANPRNKSKKLLEEAVQTEDRVSTEIYNDREEHFFVTPKNHLSKAELKDIEDDIYDPIDSTIYDIERNYLQKIPANMWRKLFRSRLVFD